MCNKRDIWRHLNESSTWGGGWGKGALGKKPSPGGLWTHPDTGDQVPRPRCPVGNISASSRNARRRPHLPALVAKPWKLISSNAVHGRSRPERPPEGQLLPLLTPLGAEHSPARHGHRRPGRTRPRTSPAPLQKARVCQAGRRILGIQHVSTRVFRCPLPCLLRPPASAQVFLPLWRPALTPVSLERGFGEGNRLIFLLRSARRVPTCSCGLQEEQRPGLPWASRSLRYRTARP